jgi:hypothetical protein
MNRFNCGYEVARNNRNYKRGRDRDASRFPLNNSLHTTEIILCSFSRTQDCTLFSSTALLIFGLVLPYRNLIGEKLLWIIFVGGTISRETRRSMKKRRGQRWERYIYRGFNEDRAMERRSIRELRPIQRSVKTWMRLEYDTAEPAVDTFFLEVNIRPKFKKKNRSEWSRTIIEYMQENYEGGHYSSGTVVSINENGSVL